MLTQRKEFDVSSLPLTGIHCIEASAGTGKTYSIVFLVLRLIIERAFNINQILVVTFTNAATEEIRGRIQERLSEVLEYLDYKQSIKDPLMTDLIKKIPKGQGDTEFRLRKAFAGINEAPVCTIHSFCKRVLDELAFESGTIFDADFLENDYSIWYEGISDFWRKKMATASDVEAQWIIGRFSNPEELCELVRRLCRPDLIDFEPLTDNLGDVSFEKLIEKLNHIKTLWHESRSEIEDILKNYKGLDRRSYKNSDVSKSIDALDEYFQSGFLYPLPTGFDRFTASMLADKTRSGHDTPEHEFFTACEEFKELFKKLPGKFLLEARAEVARFVRNRKLEEGILTFDDLIIQLHRALKGSFGEKLARAIRRRFPVALIDEFQDTDSVQYEIFRRIYDTHENRNVFLCLIGDPKQAIYAFRGADVFAYMKARDAENVDCIWTMDTNWRSDERLIKAINQIFSSNKAPFIYSRIPYINVESAFSSEKTNREWTYPEIDGKEPPALIIRFLTKSAAEVDPEKKINKGHALDLISGDCASQIARLLRLASEGHVRVNNRPLAPGDIAVLVPTHRCGVAIQDALRQFNIASVTVSQESVFASDEALDFLYILEAVLNASDDRLVRNALATEIMGWTADLINELSRDDRRLEEVQSKFFEYASMWQRSGFLAFFMDFLRNEGVVLRLAELDAGERRLTNLLHLAELIHRADTLSHGMDRTVSWLRRKIFIDEEEGEEEQLRLESDENLVQILTVHRSKGLEFPVVFCPFLWWENPGGQSGGLGTVYHDPDTFELRFDVEWDDSDMIKELARKEHLAENVRLAYVALTRARYLCIMHWGPINGASKSGMSWIFFPGKMEENEVPTSSVNDTDEDAMLKRLRKISEQSEGTVAVEVISKIETEQEKTERRDSDTKCVQLCARTYNRRDEIPWRVSSYSGLILDTESDLFDYWLEESTSADVEVLEDVLDPVFAFPTGARAGRCIHEIFQNIDFPSSRDVELEKVTVDTLKRYGFDPEKWKEGATKIIENTLDTPLGFENLKLRKIEKRDRISEMEFHFRVGRFSIKRLEKILKSDSFFLDSLDGLASDEFQGLMHGYIDLIFRWNNRFYIVDYKTNHLGNRPENYSREALRRAMVTHRYPLQVIVYTVALHRHLKVCFNDYDYDKHLGGVFYLFCRGMTPDRGNEYGVFFVKPEREMIMSVDKVLNGGR